MTTTSAQSESIDTAYALLAEGERLIAAGQYREGSASVYQAAFTALQAVAERRSWVCETEQDVGDIIHRLDGVEPLPDDAAEAIKVAFERVDDPLPVFSTLLVNVDCFKLHSATVFRDGVSLPVYFWEPEDYVKSLPLVKKFIDLLRSELHNTVDHDP
ncbi:MAG: hypothetical protein F4X64_17965 [Chloroflexi bacterium]|nr:hypothetical protein [Chloroflexota bacterium]